MRKMANVALCAMGLAAFAVPASAVADDVAKLPRQGSTYLVFLTSDGGLPAHAREIIRTAAATLKYDRSVTLEGRPAYVEKVKHELIRNGVSPQIIKDQSMDVGLAVSNGDGLNTSERVVEIKRR